MAENERKTMIVTFKPKDERDATDKIEILRSVLDEDQDRPFMDASMASMGRALPSRTDVSTVGYDVNRYKAPLAIASLTEAEVAKLQAEDAVLRVEEDGLMYAMQDATVLPPDGPMAFEGVPVMQANTIPWGLSAIGAPDAWDFSRGKAIKVFVLDTGISPHPALGDNLREGRSFVPDESSTDDFNSHGTHCAGTIAAAFNNVGVVGVAPAAYVHPVKVLSRSGSGNWSWLIAALDWVADKKGHRIASMSLGGASAPNALEDMCNAVADDGVLLIAAAGNSGPGPNTVGAPGRYESVMAVSAIDNANQIANFSSRGAEVEICAPGVNVLSTIPGDRYGSKNGTSMACPHVAGAAALAWGSHRWADASEIRTLLTWSADNLGVAGRDELYGYGRVDAHQAAASSFQPTETTEASVVDLTEQVSQRVPRVGTPT